MSILSTELLNPVRYQTQDPFASICKTIESWLTIHQPEYLISTWPQIKYDYLKRLLGVEKKGSYLRSYAQTAPNDDLGSALMSVYEVIDRSVYFTSKYWRAFYYYLKHNKFSTCWPQFGSDEAELACSLLTEDELQFFRSEADKEWLDYSSSEATITKLLKDIKKPLLTLCYKRVSFLSDFDPMYSSEDIYQCANEEILIRLRNNDYIPSNPQKLIGWALKCADNALHNLRTKALAQSRSGFHEVPCDDWNYDSDEMDTTMINQSRMIPLHHGGEHTQWECPENVVPESLTVLNVVEDSICVQNLLEHADPKINTYIRTICCGEHNPDFWTWFYQNEPSLAQRPAYVAENPEAIGPFLQRHLKLPTHQLTRFLKQHLPEILERVSNTPVNKAKIAHAG
jgi:hypothetical protein